jgi:phage shock protein PspC (stress-responsive transcriptional regulator)
MRFIPSNYRFSVFGLLLGALALSGFAVSSPRAGSASDSAAVDAPTPPSVPEPPTRKRIVIGGSGVRIEDDEMAADEDTTGDHDFDFDFQYDGEEYGDDIVKVGESVFVAAGDVVAGDVVVFGGNAIIEGTVAGSVVVLGGEIRARRGSEIKGDIVAIGGTIEEDEDVVIRGEKILIGGVAGRIGDQLDVSSRTLRVLFVAVCLFVALVLYFITMLFLRGRVVRASDHLASGLMKCFGAGVLAWILGSFALLIVMIPLIITIVGIPLAVILGMSWLGVVTIASTVFVYAVGRSIATRMGTDAGVFVRLAIGLAVLVIPCIVSLMVDAVGGPTGLSIFFQALSFLIWSFGFLVGLGAIVLSRFGTRPPVNTEPPLARNMPELAPSPGV